MSTIFALVVIALARIAVPVMIVLSIGEFANRRRQHQMGS